VLFPAGTLTRELDASAGWHRVLDDHGTLLYSRGTPGWATGASTCP
jgi:hypothetical protein